MLKKIYNTLVSTTTMAVLFGLFAVSMAVATFVETKFGTETARTLIYDSWWFELIMLLGAVNLTGNIIRFKLYRKQHWHSFIFHSAFLLILIGAAVTRYIGYEGQVPIVEGETAHELLTEKNYIFIRIDDGKEQKGPFYERFKYNALGKNSFRFQTDFRGTPVQIRLLRYVPHYQRMFQPADQGREFLKVVEAASGKRNTVMIPDGESKSLGFFRLAFGVDASGDIQIFSQGDSLVIRSRVPGLFQVMETGQTGNVVPDSLQRFYTGALYTFDQLNFVVPGPPEKGKEVIVSGDANAHPWNYLEFVVHSGQQTDTVAVVGGQYYTGAPAIFRLGDLNFVLGYGPKKIPLDFGVKLRDFQIDYYPGSQSPKSFASEITVIDKDTTFDYRIFMNHVLDYKGFRFFQASYSITPQYEQTILSVNHDFWGTWITYIGYALLYFGLLMIFVNPHSMFNRIGKQLKYIRKKKKELGLAVLLLMSFPLHAQHGNDTLVPQLDIMQPQNTGRVLRPTIVPDSVAQRFAGLIIQDYGGRMKPVQTYASELLRKLSKHDDFVLPGTDTKISAEQALFSMLVSPEVWTYVPVIYLERGDEKVRGILGIPKGQKYARLVDFFDGQGNYKLASYVSDASKHRIKSKFDKDVENIDKRVNLLYGTLMQTHFRLFPKPGDAQHRWYAPVDVAKAGFTGRDSLFVGKIIPMMRQALMEKNMQLLTTALQGIDDFQRKYGADVYPDPKKVRLEIYYNKHDAFRTMFWKLMLASLALLVLAIVRIVRDNRIIRILITVNKWVILLMFLWMVYFLALRGYISGHAPWSDAYESMIYVTLSTLLFGLIFGRKSEITLASTAFVASIMLMVAHWNWMDPAIENLVPVLDSYWLMIHVAVIVASYGPFILGAMLALLTLMFILFTTTKNKPKFELVIKELTDINKQALIVGLVLLTIGNFLGGQWANESWGRYWGWDPKETWALISIMVYALVIHAHLVPSLRGLFRFNTMALWAVWVIMMTYFGVNFYLAGLHSYAKGEPVKTPGWIFVTALILALINLASWWRYRKMYLQEEK